LIKTVKIVTLGCPKNIVDSEVLAQQLDSNNFNVTFESANTTHYPIPDTRYPNPDTQFVIINTCGFINDAKQESIDTIIKYLKEKKQGKIKHLFVTGCLSQRYKDELMNELPDVDAYFGTEAYSEIIRKLNGKYNHKLLSDRTLITPSHYAYLKIAEGCNQKCTYCAIPLIRGKYVSRSINHLVKEARLLAEKGVKELILIAEDSTYYGLDIYGKRKIADLIDKISNVDGIEWIRLQYAFPGVGRSFQLSPPDLLKVIKDNPKVCKYLDIPFQHISDNILKSMKRGITREQTYNLIEKIRTEVPEIAIRTSIITGYPLEKEKQFSELLEFIKTVRFERLGVFTYSHEENTASYKLKDSVPQKIKLHRADEIMKLQQKISTELNKNKVGKTLKVLIDRKDDKYFHGRTESDSPEIDNEVLIPVKNKKLEIGKFYNIKIASAKPYDLISE
jgi:ribosomal protein S12 methylthiotransferase